MIFVYTQNTQCHVAPVVLFWGCYVRAWHNIPVGNVNSGTFLDVSSVIKLHSPCVSWYMVLIFAANTLRSGLMLQMRFGGRRLDVGCDGAFPCWRWSDIN